MDLDFERCYRAVSSQDPRFDGWFVTAVTSTGIYCRPSCPAMTPKRANVRFYPSAAAAQRGGFRACKRCRPDVAPGSPEWDVRADVVGRAMRLIADGVVDREGVPGLAARLAYTPRHLHRLLRAELGAGPLALARAQRAQTARILVEATDLGLADIAFASGFGSVRQFNDTLREVYAGTPSQLRAAARRRGPAPEPTRVAAAPGPGAVAALAAPAGAGEPGAAGTIALRLAYRAPLPAPALLEFLAARAIPGVEAAGDACGAGPGRRSTAGDARGAGPGRRSTAGDACGAGPGRRSTAGPDRYARALRLPHGAAIVELCPADGYVSAVLRLADLRDLAPAVARCRRLLDLDADPVAVDEVLGADPALAPAVAKEPGLRVPRAVDGFEIAVRAIVGQQISVAGARTVLGKLVRLAAPVPHGPDDPDEPDRLRPFPDAASVADAPDEAFAMPAARRATIRALAAAVAAGEVVLDDGAERAETEAALRRIPGIGAWTAGYVAMRALGDPDVFLPTDLGVRRGAARLGLPDDPAALAEHAQRWRPWRSYAVLRLWRADLS